MLAVLPADPTKPSRVDPDWQREDAAAREAGFVVVPIDHDAVSVGDCDRGLERVPSGEGCAVYRGWMLRSERYGAMHGALVSRGYAPLTDPDAYARCHELPLAIPALAAWTPRTVWTHSTDMVDADAALARLGARTAVLKDFVKSRKHEWNEACFLPDTTDRAAVERVIRRFLELQGSDFVGGLVFREFVDLEIAGAHPRSGMPLAREHRFFIVDGRVALSVPYWDEAPPGDAPDPSPFLEISKGLASRFFTLDVAKRRAGGWIVVEPGDGQVAGIPVSVDPAPVWRALAAAAAIGS